MNTKITTLEIADDGTVTIPVDLVRALRLSPRQTITVETQEDALVLVPSLRPGSVQGSRSSLVSPSRRGGTPRSTGGWVGSLLEVGAGFHPELTGRENIYLNGAILGMKRAEIERKFDEMVAFAEIEKFMDTPVGHYSSGMYVRLAFAVAAQLDPEILMMDEVLVVSDTVRE